MYREDGQTMTRTRDDGSISNPSGQSNMSGQSSMMGQLTPYMDKIQQVVNRYQQNPEELKGLLKNKAVIAIGAALALALLTGQIRSKR